MKRTLLFVIVSVSLTGALEIVTRSEQPSTGMKGTVPIPRVPETAQFLLVCCHATAGLETRVDHY